MSDSPKVDVCVGIPGNCPMTYIITAQGDEIEFSFGGPFDGFHHVFEIKALHQFLDIAAKALSEIRPKGSAARPAEASCSPQSTHG